ncbi:type II toxin-antitoxin system RelE/ParE family toxin [Candidatus Saganbacteria bacterium]|nr:type II toxin-antitoxin system RelE/ParE family toxin [Candidatus Saganbacteria bacterium]
MYQLVIHKSAAKKFKKLPKYLQDQISQAFDSLILKPFFGKKLHGELKGSFRLRIGDFRVIYDIYQNEKKIVVHAIGSRGDIYK